MTNIEAAKDIVSGDFNGDGVTNLIASNYTAQSLTFFNAITAASLTENTFSLATQSAALSAITTLATVQNKITTELGNIGAYQSCLEIAHNNLQGLVANLDTAISRIMDIDVAEETTNMLRLQVLQQGASAVLAHTLNDQDLVLQLLQG